jgi:osmoprotectant transport system substrate-binding protein
VRRRTTGRRLIRLDETRRIRLTLTAGVLAAVITLTGCHPGRSTTTPATTRLDDDVITVGSFDFDESSVVAEVYSQGLEVAGYKVHRAYRLGPREFVGPALSAGLIEFVPEYAGTAAEFHSLGRAEPTGDAERAHAELVQAIAGTHLVALAAAPAQDANAFVVTAETSGRLNLHRLSDLTNAAAHLRFGGPPECATRPLCLIGLAQTYGVNFAEVLTLDSSGPLTVRALTNGHVDVALMFTTDPAIARDHLVELVDDRRLQPAENITPLLRREIIDRWGQAVVATIDAVSSRLTTAAVRELNNSARSEGADVADIAATWWSRVRS